MSAAGSNASEFARAMGPVARAILGEPTEHNRAKGELRFGSRGSLSVNLGAGTWFDHEANAGGGVLDFVRLRINVDKAGALAWLQDHGHIEKSAPPKQKKQKKIIATYDYAGPDGGLLYQVVRYEPKDFRQRHPDGSGGWLWKMNGVQRVLYRLPDVAALEPDSRVYLVEGEKGADALVALGLSATCSPMGANKWRDEYASFLRDLDVVVLPDNDEPGRQHAATVAKSLEKHAKRVRILELPSLPDKGDIVDWIAAGGTREAIEELAESAEPEPPKTKEITRRSIAVQKSKFNINAEEGEAALLAADYPVFRRDRQLVRPVVGEVEASEGRTTTTVMLVELERPVLRQMLNEVADWQRFDTRSKAMVAAAPPTEVAELILARVGYWPFRPISGVIATPTIRPDGSLLTTPGYDAATGLWLNDLPSMPAIPDKPTRQDADRALDDLDKLLDGFPFVDATARAVALSGIITPVVRAIMAVAPMHVASAPAPGTGKSYLWDLASYIAVGQPCAVTSAAKDEAETEKRLVGSVLRGHPMISIDNLNGPIDGDFVCHMIERPLLELRPLGTSDKIFLRNRVTSYATGNNIRARGDIVRRLIHCRLDANVEHPERRQFTSKPHQLVLDNRGRYIAACLTIIRAYIVADRPGLLPPLASFEGWSDSVRSALVWLGYDDPVGTIETAHGDDDRNAEAAALFAAWPEYGKYKAAQLLEAAQEGDGTGGLLRPDLLDALKPIARDKRSNLDAAVLAYWLRDHKDRVVGKQKLVRRGSATRPTWTVEDV
jgi:putative DNA primase/helicase